MAIRPTLRDKTKFTFEEIPRDTSFEAGYLVSVNSGFRKEHPIIQAESCCNCMQCYLYCPDGAIEKDNDIVSINYDFCKGCGICEKICKRNAIHMEVEQ